MPKINTRYIFMNLNQLLQMTVTKDASDLHLLVDSAPIVRVNGELMTLQGMEILKKEDIEGMIYGLVTPRQKEIYESEWELDLGIDFEGKVRFRINVYRQRGSIAVSFRLIPRRIKTIEETGLPDYVGKLTTIKQGLVLVTGPTGHGKSTTLAAFINKINLSRAAHIVTVEDPVEFVYPQAKSIISQRELNTDTKSWANALKAALREDPDVVLIGEMRDLETISSALTIAETGHLVFATLHTNSAGQSIDRIIDVFPSSQQPQIKVQLSAVLEAIISQRLIPTINPGRVLAAELLFTTPALRSQIRESKTHLIDNLIQTSAEQGMISLETSLAFLVREGKITIETALNYSLKPGVLNQLLGLNTKY